MLGKHDDAVQSIVWSPQYSKLFFPSRTESMHALVLINPIDVLISASWDSTIKVWDPYVLLLLVLPYTCHVIHRLTHFFFSSSSDTPLKSTQPLPARAYNLAYAPSSSRLLVSMAHRHVYVYDVAKLAAATEKIPASQERESALKFMTRSVATMADGKGISIAWFFFFFLEELTQLRS